MITIPTCVSRWLSDLLSGLDNWTKTSISDKNLKNSFTVDRKPILFDTWHSTYDGN